MSRFLLFFTLIQIFTIVSLLSQEEIVLLKVRGEYGVLNKGRIHGMEEGETFLVIREQGNRSISIGEVMVILTQEEKSAVKLLSTKSSKYLQVGDRLLPLRAKESPPARGKTLAAEARPVLHSSSLSQSTSSANGAYKNSPLLALNKGAWVKVRGNIPTGRAPVATKIEEIKASPDFNPSRMEIYARAENELKLNGRVLLILNKQVYIREETRFENSHRQQVPRFLVQKGEWLKVKVKIAAGDSLFARVVRSIEPRDRFKVFGRLEDVLLASNGVQVGGIFLIADAYVEMVHPGDKTRGTPMERFMQNEQKSVLFSVRPGENLYIGGQLGSKSRADDERDLQISRRKDKQIFNGEMKLDLLWRINNRNSFTFFEGIFSAREQLRNQIHESTTYSIKVSQAYLFWVFSNHLSLQAGRQDFDEEREWIYDDQLDAMRLRVVKSFAELEISASTTPGLYSGEIVTNETHNAIGVLRFRLNPRYFIAAYIIKRNSTNPAGFSPLLYGLRFYNWPRKGLRYWLELAKAGGRDAFETINGYAFDGGLTFAPAVVFSPTFTIAAAFATGADNPESQRGAFRQTGLQDNNSRFGGVTSFRYYGEVMDPELSNRLITTLGVGIRPLRYLSTEFIFHSYRQDKLSSDIGLTRLKTQANGKSRELGREMDLIVGYRPVNWLTSELVLGRFVPGAAFDHQDPAHIAQFQFRVKF
ncbi:MAG: alginate export family protein [Calditrichia bacterium]